MQGKARTQKTDDLPLIFWHIRTARDAKARRSWQRRARLALEKRADLTPAERHEVAAVWSARDVSQIDSPALRKLLGQPAQRPDHQTRPARTHMRAAFNADGSRKTAPKEKAGLPRLSLDIDYGAAANDPAANPLQLALI